MALFYPPPQPFIGAWQPLEPRKLTPPSVPVNNPPGYRQDGLLVQINASWILPFQYPPSLQLLVQGFVAPSVNPPYTTTALLAQINLAWQPGPPQPPVGQRLTPPSVPVNNPPGYSVQPLAQQIVAAWQPYLLQPQVLETITPPQSVDNPPGYRLDSALTEFNLAWQLPFQMPPPLVLMPQGIVAVVNNPPGYTLNWLLGQLNLAWQPGPPLPTLLTLQTPPSGPLPPPPVAPYAGGGYPGDEWTGRREKKSDAALQQTERMQTEAGIEVTPTVFAQRYLAARKKYQDKEDEELYTALLHFMMQMDDDNED